MNILISSAGRRVSLMQRFREALRDLGLRGRIAAIDRSPHAPAGRLADTFHQVPSCKDPDFLPAALEVCRRERVRLLVPTIDPELRIYAAARESLLQAGTLAAVSSPEAVAICADKAWTRRWLARRGFPCVRQSTPRLAIRNPAEWPLPVIVKPSRGSASAGVRKAFLRCELEAAAASGEELLVEEIAPGVEFTVNVYVNRSGRAIAAVPHRRWEVRAGEVSKGVTVKHRPLMNLARRIAEALPGAFGPLNVQCFADGSELRVIEINPRFGGGYPLAHRAGAAFTHWLLREALGQSVEDYDEGWQDGLGMLRYDAELFFDAGAESAMNAPVRPEREIMPHAAATGTAI